MPSPHTFSIKPISELLDGWLAGAICVVDPFSGNSTRGTHRNDLRNGGMDAETFAKKLQSEGVVADAILFDPPYSPRQISECYKSVGLAVGLKETQNAALYKRVRDAMVPLLRVGGIAVSCGWNSAGFGKDRGFGRLETLLVSHGGAHNDTIVVVEYKLDQ